MDDGDDFRGWDLWVEGGKVAAHIIHKWPDDALKVVSDGELKPNVWNHVLVTYDGSGKAAGIKIYLDGKLRTNRVDADTLKGTIRTKAPFKLGQRSNSSKVEDADLPRPAGLRPGPPGRGGRPPGQRRPGRLPGREAGRQAARRRGRGRLRLVSRDPGPGLEGDGRQARQARAASRPRSRRGGPSPTS